MNGFQNGELERYRYFIHGFKSCLARPLQINYARMYEKTLKRSAIAMMQAEDYGKYVARVVNASFYIAHSIVQKLAKGEFFLSVVKNAAGTQLKYESFMCYADADVLTNVLADIPKNVRDSELCQKIFNSYCVLHNQTFGTEFFLATMI